MNLVGDGAGGDGGFEAGLIGKVLQADVELCARLAVGDVPHFGLWFATKLDRNICGRMDLDGEVVGAIEDLDQDGETWGVREFFAEDLGAVVGPQIMQGFSGKFPRIDDGLFVLAIDDFPCLAERDVGRG